MIDLFKFFVNGRKRLNAVALRAKREKEKKRKREFFIF